MALRVSEEIPEDPPECPEDYKRLSWQMQRENYRIAREYERMTRGAKLVVSVLLWIFGSVATVFTFWEMIRPKPHP